MHQRNLEGHKHDEQEKLRQRFRHLSLLLTLAATINNDNHQPIFHHRDVIQEKLGTISHCRNPEPTPMEAALGVFVRRSETLAATSYGAENLIVAHLMEPNDTSNDSGRNHSYSKAPTVASDYQHSSTTDEAGAPCFVSPCDAKHRGHKSREANSFQLVACGISQWERVQDDKKEAGFLFSDSNDPDDSR
jgi:hypothetical protein